MADDYVFILEYTMSQDQAETKYKYHVPWGVIKMYLVKVAEENGIKIIGSGHSGDNAVFEFKTEKDMFAFKLMF